MCTLPINPLGIHLLQCPCDNDHIGKAWYIMSLHISSRKSIRMWLWNNCMCFPLPHYKHLNDMLTFPLQRWGVHFSNNRHCYFTNATFFCSKHFLHTVSYTCISFVPSNFYTCFCNFRGNPSARTKLPRSTSKRPFLHHGRHIFYTTFWKLSWHVIMNNAPDKNHCEK